MWQAHMDEFGIHAFDVGKHEQLFDGGMVAHVAFEFGVGVTPLFRCLAEKGDIEHIGFVGVGDRGLSGRDFRRNEVCLYGVGVNAVIELGEGAVEVPGKREAAVFVFFKALELLDEVELELDGYPGSELECDVLVGVSAAVASGFWK